MENQYNKELFESLRRMNRMMHRMGHRNMKADDLHRGQIHLLKILEQNDGIVQRDLAVMMDIRPSSLTEMVVRMEEGNHLIRKQDEKDQRMMHLHLTEKGKQTLASMAESEMRINGDIFGSLTEEEAKTMIQLSRKLCENMERIIGSDDESHWDDHRRGGRGGPHGRHGGPGGHEGHGGCREHHGHEGHGCHAESGEHIHHGHHAHGECRGRHCHRP